MDFSDTSIKKISLFSSIGLLMVSLTQKSFCTQSGCDDYSIFTFLFGGLGFFLSPAGLTWLANPLVIAAWVNNKLQRSLIYSLLALLLSVSFLFFNKVVIDEAGLYSKIIGYKLGYWLWLASMAVMAVGNIFLFLRSRQQHST